MNTQLLVFLVVVITSYSIILPMEKPRSAFSAERANLTANETEHALVPVREGHVSFYIRASKELKGYNQACRHQPKVFPCKFVLRSPDSRVPAYTLDCAIEIPAAVPKTNGYCAPLLAAQASVRLQSNEPVRFSLIDSTWTCVTFKVPPTLDIQELVISQFSLKRIKAPRDVEITYTAHPDNYWLLDLQPREPAQLTEPFKLKGPRQSFRVALVSSASTYLKVNCLLNKKNTHAACNTENKVRFDFSSVQPSPQTPSVPFELILEQEHREAARALMAITTEASTSLTLGLDVLRRAGCLEDQPVEPKYGPQQMEIEVNHKRSNGDLSIIDSVDLLLNEARKKARYTSN